jgi:hypothetical protein
MMQKMKPDPIAWVITVEYCGEDTNNEWEVLHEFIEREEWAAEETLKKFTVPNFTRRVDHEYRSRKESLYASGQVRGIVKDAFEDARNATTAMGGLLPFDRTYWRASEEIEEAIGRAEEWFMTKTLKDL